MIKREIAVFRRASFYWDKRRRALAHLLHHLIHLRVAGFHRVHLYFQALVLAQLKLRQHLEHRAELQRLAFLEFDLVHFRPRHRHEFLLVKRLLQVFRHQRLQHFALNVVRKSPANQSHRRLPRTESRNPRHARQIARYFLGRFRHILGWNFQLDLTLASCLCHGIFSGEHCGTPWFQSAFHRFEARERGWQGSAARNRRK